MKLLHVVTKAVYAACARLCEILKTTYIDYLPVSPSSVSMVTTDCGFT